MCLGGCRPRVRRNDRGLADDSQLAVSSPLRPVAVLGPSGGSLWDERGMSTDSLWCVPSGFATNLIECSQPLDAVTSERNTHTQANTNIPIAFVNEQRFAQHLRLPHRLAALLAY